MEIITSLENKKIKYINKLKNKKFRDEEGIFVIETKHLVEEAYKSGFLTELYLVDTNIESNILEDDKINKYQITKEIMNKILKSLYIIIALLLINILVVITTNGSVKKEETKTDDTEENTECDVSMFTSIDADGVVDAFKSSEMKVIYMGRSTCGYCVQFLPNLQKAQEEYGYETLYLDISTVDSDGQSKIVDLDKDFFEENYGATPTVLLVKDNKIVDSHVGYSEYDNYAKFLEKNGFSKK